MANLLITKEQDNFFSFVVDGNVAEKVTNLRNDVLVRDGSLCDFKTANGANIIKIQQINVNNITLVASDTFTFTNVNEFLQTLIEEGFFDWITSSGGGGGSGTNRFDELIDTFDYFGQNGKAVRVNETQQKLETFTVYNYRKLTDLEDTFNTILPNKMLTTSNDGQEIVLRDIPNLQSDLLNAIGSVHYSNGLGWQTFDSNNDTEVKLLNDTLGSFTDRSQLPFGVTDIWNPATNQFDFSQLQIGDWVDLRLDLLIDFSATNASFNIYMLMGIGSSSPWTLNIHNGERKSPTLFNEKPYIGFDINNESTRNFPAELWIAFDNSCGYNFQGMLAKIIRKDVNIVNITETEEILYVATLPLIGVANKLYIRTAVIPNTQHRWTGSSFVDVGGGGGGGGGVTDHNLLTNIGTKTHAQIDSHIDSTSNPHGVTKAQIGLPNVPNLDTSTTLNITDSANKRFVTDAQIVNINANTGDETTATIQAKRPLKTVEGQSLEGIGNVTIPMPSDLVEVRSVTGSMELDLRNTTQYITMTGNSTLNFLPAGLPNANNRSVTATIYLRGAFALTIANPTLGVRLLTGAYTGNATRWNLLTIEVSVINVGTSNQNWTIQITEPETQNTF